MHSRGLAELVDEFVSGCCRDVDRYIDRQNPDHIVERLRYVMDGALMARIPEHPRDVDLDALEFNILILGERIDDYIECHDTDELSDDTILATGYLRRYHDLEQAKDGSQSSSESILVS